MQIKYMSLKGVKQSKEHAAKRGLAISTHRMSGTKLHRTWKRMRARCNSKTNNDYRHYGGRGIKISKDWEVFINFHRDMASSYSEGLEIDRIDNNRGYSKENCRWATRKEQVNNTRRCHLLTFKGKTLNITQWSEELNIPRSRLAARINEYGWSIERTLTEERN